MDRQAWLENLRLAWAEGRTELVDGLFRYCDVYWETPWEQVPKEDLMSVWDELSGNRAVSLTFNVLSETESGMVVEWYYTSHEREELAGALALRFDEHDRCRELKMWSMERRV